MNSSKALLAATAVCASLLGSLTSVAHAESRDLQIQLSPRIGYGLARLDEDRIRAGRRETRDVYEAGLVMGVAAPFGLVVEGGLRRGYAYTSLADGDDFEVSHLTAAIGYQIEGGRGVRITPKVGRTYWRLYDVDSDLFNGSVPAEPEGYDYFWEVGLQKLVGRSHAIGLTVGDTGFEFGRVGAVHFTVTFGF